MDSIPRIFDRFRTGYRCQDCGRWFRESHVCGDRGQHTHVYLKVPLRRREEWRP